MSITMTTIAARGALTAAFIAAATFATAADETLATPTGPVVLTVSGAINQMNEGDTAQFDFEMLKAMPAVEFTTETIWTEGPQDFQGVLLSDFLEAVGADGEGLSVQAINDYTVQIPMSDAVEGGPIIAYSLNDAEMSRRDKGPLWIVYPYDASSDYRSEVIYSRSIWQLDRIVVE